MEPEKILTEASNIDTFTQLLDNINKQLDSKNTPNLKAKLEAYAKATPTQRFKNFNQYLTAVDEAKESLDNTLKLSIDAKGKINKETYNTIIADINSWIKSVDDLAKNYSSLYSQKNQNKANTLINKVLADYEIPELKQDITDNNIRNLNNDLQRLNNFSANFKNELGLSQNFDDKIEKITDLTKKAEELLNSLSLILSREPSSLNTDFWKDYFNKLPKEDIQKVINIFNNANNTLTTLLGFHGNQIDPRIKNIEAVQKAFDPIIKIEAKEKELADKKAVEEQEQTDIENKLNAKESNVYEKKYHSCKTEKDFENFWAWYFKSAWNAEDINFVSEILGSAFKIMVLDYGFTEDKNPFIAFIKSMLYNKDANIIRSFKKNFSSVDLENLVTAYEDNDITAADLRGNLTGYKNVLFGEYNVIFNPYFYSSLTPSDQKRYLRLQKRLANSSYSINKKYSKYWKSGKNYFWAYISLANSKTIVPDSQKILPPGLPLSSLSTAQEKFKKLVEVDDSDSAEVTATNDTVQRVLKEVNNNEALAKKLLAYVTASFESQFSVVIDKLDKNTFKNKLEQNELEEAKKRQRGDSATFNNWLGIGKIRYDSRIFTELVTSLAKVAKLV